MASRSRVFNYVIKAHIKLSRVKVGEQHCLNVTGVVHVLKCLRTSVEMLRDCDGTVCCEDYGCCWIRTIVELRPVANLGSTFECLCGS
jgi:hypothetical protein